MGISKITDLFVQLVKLAMSSMMVYQEKSKQDVPIRPVRKVVSVQCTSHVHLPLMMKVLVEL